MSFFKFFAPVGVRHRTPKRLLDSLMLPGCAAVDARVMERMSFEMKFKFQFECENEETIAGIKEIKKKFYKKKYEKKIFFFL